MPPIVYLLCGLTGSGKTTYAKRLEASGAVRLSVDEEIYARHGRYGVDYPMEEYFDRERPVVEELRHRLVELVESGQDVVLDYGLWRRSDRDAYKRLIEAHGGTWRLLYFKADREVLTQRLAERNRRDDAGARTAVAGGRPQAGLEGVEKVLTATQQPGTAERDTGIPLPSLRPAPLHRPGRAGRDRDSPLLLKARSGVAVAHRRRRPRPATGRCHPRRSMPAAGADPPPRLTSAVCPHRSVRLALPG
jgi:predicted kinase